MMLEKVHEIYRNYHDWRRIVWKSENEYDVSLYCKIKYALKGFSTNEYIWYDFKHNDYRQYISEYERMRSRSINGAYKLILDDKMIFEEIFRQYARVPINYAWIENGYIYALHDYAVGKDNLIPFLFEKKKSILKYLSWGGGIGAFVIDTSEGRLRINGNTVSEETVRKLFDRKGKSVLCEYIMQSDFSASLYPHTANTIRMICAKRKGEDRAHVIAAVQKIGRQCSIPVDNLSRGGLVCEIDFETGELAEVAAESGDRENRIWDVHPDTGVPIKGKKIPNWDRLKNDIEVLTNRIPYLNFVAWDILLTESKGTSNEYCVIEGNASTGCNLLQMKSGHRNKALGEIYKSYGIIG